MLVQDLAAALQQPLEGTLATLVRASRLDKYAVIESPASQEQIAQAEERTGFALDPMHRELLKLCNGGRFRCFSGGPFDWFGTHPRGPRTLPGQHNTVPRLPEIGVALPAGENPDYVAFAGSGGMVFCYRRAGGEIVAVDGATGTVAPRAADFSAFFASLDVRVNMSEYSRDVLRRLAGR